MPTAAVHCSILAIYPLYLPCISLYLPYISLYLPYISPISPLYRGGALLHLGVLGGAAAQVDEGTRQHLARSRGDLGEM